jgi:pimeloyl-ACP methyl ester carboxylesterase
VTVADQLSMTVHAAPVPLGAAVLLPGFLDGRHDPALTGLSQALQAAGITAVTFDPRGTWSSPGDPADVAPTRQLADLGRLLDRHAAERTILIGHCYGALLAALAAAADPRVTDVVALMPTRCFIWPEDYDPAKDTWRDDGERLFVRTGQRITVPYSAVRDALGYDLPATLAGLRQRILFVAGERDELIGVEPVRRLHAECGSPGKRLAVLPVQHDFRELPAEIELVSRTILDWLGQAGH